MQQELHVAPSGLFTDPHTAKAPPGALRTAENIVIRRDGIIEPRPGFVTDDSFKSDNILRAISFNGDLVLLFDSGTYWYSTYDTLILNEDGDDLVALVENFRGCQARNNLYIPFGDGVRKLTGAAEAVALITGGPIPGDFSKSGTPAGVAIANNTTVKYRFLISRTDANGVIVKSIPSRDMIFTNTSGSAVNFSLHVMFTGMEKVGDIIELYRSMPYGTSDIPDDELGLIKQHTLTSLDLSGGSVNIVDDVLPLDEGALIYTAPSQEGAVYENNRPPKCTDLALFKGSVFYANTEGPQRVILEIAQRSDDNQSGEATGVGQRWATADFTSGSNQVTNVSDTTGYQIGQIIEQPDCLPVLTRTYITNISGTTLTISQNATANGTTKTILVIDTVIIGTPTDYSIFEMIGSVSSLQEDINLQHKDGTTNVVARSVGSFHYQNAALVYPLGNGTLIIENAVLGALGFYVWATHGEAYFPMLTGPTGYAAGLFTGITTANGAPSKSDDFANRILWSKTDQPEHVPEVNYAPVGSEAHAILRVIPTRDALFIFKQDGIWRLTGAGADSGWRIDEFDLSTYLLRPDAAAEYDNGIYAWTNKGMVRVTDSGIQLISAPAIGNQIKYQEFRCLAASSGYYDAFVCVNPKDNEVILYPFYAGSETYVYIYNTKTLAWYQWNFSLTELHHIVYNEHDRLLYAFGLLSSNSVALVERISNTLLDVVDEQYDITVTSVSNNVVTISTGSGWTPERGDGVYRTSTGDTYIVTAVIDSTHFMVSVSGMSATSYVAYKAVQSTIEWAPKTAGNEGIPKHYIEGGFTFAAFVNIWEVLYSFWSSLSSTAVSYYEYFKIATSHDDWLVHKPKTVRFVVPKAHARAVYLYPKITIRQAFSRFELSGLSLFYNTLRGRGIARGDGSAVIPPEMG